MDDVIKSIKAHLYDRIASPLSGALIISWCLWNYKVLFVLFSSEIMEYKLNFIDVFYAQVFSFHGWIPSYQLSNALINGVVGPISTTLIYIFIYPVFAVPVYMFSLWVQKIYEKAKNRHQREKLLTYDQSIELHKKIADLELQQENEHKDYLTRIEALNDLINKKNLQLSDAEKKYNELVVDREESKSSITESYELSKLSDATAEANLTAHEGVLEAAENDKDILLKPELAELENFIVESLLQKSAGDQFVFSSIIPVETWAHFDDEKRFSLEASFRMGVDNRRYQNVKVSNEQRAGAVTKYTILDFPEYKDSNIVLHYILGKISNNKAKTVQLNELRSWREFNYFLLKKGIDYLLEKGFVENVINNGRSAYRMKKEGELFLAGSR